MQTVNDYLAHADECDRLARIAKSGEQRKMIEGMAATWRMLASQRVSKLERESKENPHDT
jgi:hypothetical protein